jgi:hypothetical protein
MDRANPQEITVLRYLEAMRTLLQLRTLCDVRYVAKHASACVSRTAGRQEAALGQFWDNALVTLRDIK